MILYSLIEATLRKGQPIKVVKKYVLCRIVG
jgi:hypothetical protein